MGIWNFFKRAEKLNTDKTGAPQELTHLLSDKEFDLILGFATKYLEKQGYVNILLEDKILNYDKPGNQGVKYQTNFSNLIKAIICEERNDWRIKTEEYLENFQRDKELQNGLLHNFEEAKECLTVRLQPASSYQDEAYGNLLESLVYTIDIPETYSVLALNLPVSFHILTVDEIGTWGIDKSQLFKIAHNNLLDKIDSIQVQQHNWDGAVFYTLFDRDFAASYCIDFANNCNNVIGEKGSLVSFPARGSVFIHPIADKNQFNIAYNHIVQKTNKFFSDDPGPISRSIYWFYENKFTVFQITQVDNELTYNIPEGLHYLLTE